MEKVPTVAFIMWGKLIGKVDSSDTVELANTFNKNIDIFGQEFN